MKFKISDKVKIVCWGGMKDKTDTTPNVGKVGEITRISTLLHPYSVRFGDCTGFCYDSRHDNGCNCADVSFFEEELELAIQPGEQLLFNFMEGV